MTGKNGFYSFFFCKSCKLCNAVRIREKFDIDQIDTAGGDCLHSQCFILLRRGLALSAFFCGTEGENKRRISQMFSETGKKTSQPPFIKNIIHVVCPPFHQIRRIGRERCDLLKKSFIRSSHKRNTDLGSAFSQTQISYIYTIHFDPPFTAV